MENSRSLEILTQAGVSLVINGETIEIKPVKLASLKKLTSALQGIAQGVLGLLASDSGIVFEKGKEITISAEGWQRISAAIENNIENVVDIMSIYTRKPREWFLDPGAGVDIEDTIVLLLAILEHHYDFFMTRLAPLIKNIRVKAESKK